MAPNQHGSCRRQILGRLSYLLVPIVWDDVVPLIGGRAGHEGHDRLGLAQVEDLVWHARFDVDEVTCLVLDSLFQAGTELVPHLSLKNIKDELEADVDMGVSHAARRDGGDIGGEFGRADVLRRHALLVMNAVPIAARAAAANGQDAVVIFNRAELDGVFVHKSFSRGCAQAADGGRIILRFEDRRAGDENVGAIFEAHPSRLRIDPAIDFDVVICA